ncbi:uncharacterized protein LOC104266089 [Ciona intestinalis]
MMNFEIFFFLKPNLLQYLGFLFVILLFQLEYSILAFPEKHTLRTRINESMVVEEHSLTQLNNTDLVKYENELKCCGKTRGCTDWETNSSSFGCGCDPNTESRHYCDHASTQMCKGDINPETRSTYIYKQPCSDVVFKTISYNLSVCGGVGITVTIFEVGRVKKLSHEKFCWLLCLYNFYLCFSFSP